MKNNKGITLIALVITIIVLLILAGVSIAMLTGNNGILSRANETEVENVKGQLEEAIKLAASTIKANKYSTAADATLKEISTDNIRTQIGTDGSMRGYTLEGTGNVIEVSVGGKTVKATLNITSGELTSIVMSVE